MVDQLYEEADLLKQQEILDQLEEDIAALGLRLSQLTKSAKPTAPSDRERRILNKKLTHIDRTLHSVNEAVSAIDSASPNKHLVKQYEVQLGDIKSNLRDAHSDMLSLELEEGDDLDTLYFGRERPMFDCSLNVSWLGGDTEPVPVTPRPTIEHKGVRLPKRDVPVFDGNSLHWRQFWEQFSVAVHERATLANSEKYVYLLHALKDSSAKVVIDGLSHHA